jgi:hypothetical protein
MAIRKVVQKSCDRCGKVEEISAESNESLGGVQLAYANSNITYPDICSKCRTLVERIVKLLGKPKKREGKKKQS